MVYVALILDSGAPPRSSLFLELGGHWPGAVPLTPTLLHRVQEPQPAPCSAWGPLPAGGIFSCVCVVNTRPLCQPA